MIMSAGMLTLLIAVLLCACRPICISPIDADRIGQMHIRMCAPQVRVLAEVAGGAAAGRDVRAAAARAPLAGSECMSCGLTRAHVLCMD